eukprot:scaffold328316_cov23-Prasinocladus_malaysianus.AAC.1
MGSEPQDDNTCGRLDESNEYLLSPKESPRNGPASEGSSTLGADEAPPDSVGQEDSELYKLRAAATLVQLHGNSFIPHQ